MTTTTYRFHKGEVTDLDGIYEIQGLGGGDWWSASDPLDGGDCGEVVTITRDIEIKITVKP